MRSIFKTIGHTTAAHQDLRRKVFRQIVENPKLQHMMLRVLAKHPEAQRDILRELAKSAQLKRLFFMIAKNEGN